MVDIIIAGNGYVPFSPQALDLIALGRRYRVPVYVRISANTGGDSGPFHHSIEAWRSSASNAWAAGASGVYVFNAYDRTRFSDKALDIYNEIGDPETLSHLSRTYLVDCDFSRWAYGGGDVAFYMPLDNPPPMPLDEAGRCVDFNCLEDSAADRPRPGVLLQLLVKGLSRGDACAFLFNGKPLDEPSNERTSEDRRTFECRVSTGYVRHGANRIEARYDPAESASGKATLVGVELRVSPGAARGR